MITIPYEVVAQQPIDADNTRVVVETLPPVVINGYGGGRITFVAPNETIEETIEAHVAKKFTDETAPQKREVVFIGKLDKIEHIIEAEDIKREEAERAKEEASQNGKPDSPEPSVEVGEKPSEPSVPVAPSPVQEQPAQPPVEQPVVEAPVVENPVVEQPKEEAAAPLPKVDVAEPAQPFVRPDVGGLGVEEKA